MKALSKDLFRELKKSFPRFISILLLVALGVLVLVGLVVSGPMMRNSLEAKLNKAQMYDLYIHNNLGLNDQDIDLLAQVKGLKDLEFRYSEDRMTKDGKYSVRLFSNTKNYARPIITKGQEPLVDGELALDEDLAKTMGLRLGDSIEFSKKESKYQPEGKEEKESLTRKSFIVVGLAQSAEAIKNDHKGTSDAGALLDGFAYIPPNSFKKDHPTDALIGLKKPENLTSSSKEYKALAQAGEKSLKDLFKGRPKDRLDLLKADIQEEIDEGKDEIKTGEEKLQDAQDQLDRARAKLEKGKRDYQGGKNKLSREVAKGEGDLASGRRKLRSGQAQLKDKEGDLNKAAADLEEAKTTLKDKEALYLSGRKDYVAGMEAYQEGKSRLEREEGRLKDGEAELESKARDLEDGRRKYLDGLAQWQDGKRQLDAQEGKIAEGRRALEEGRAKLEATKAQLDQGQGAIDKQRTEIQGAVNQAQGAVNQAQAGLNTANAQLKALEALPDGNPGKTPENLAQAQAGVQKAQAALDKAQAGLEKAKAGLQAFEAGVKDKEAQLAAGRQEYDQGLKTFQAQEARFQEGARAFEEGRAELEANRRKLDQAKAQIDEGSQQLEEGRRKIQDGYQKLAKGKITLKNSYQELEKARIQLEDGKKKLDEGKDALDQGEKDLAQGKDKFLAGQKALKESQEKLNQGARRLAKEKAKGEAKLAKAKADLDKGARDLAQGEKDFAEESKDARKKIDQAKLDIENAGEILEVLNRPLYTIYSRLTNPNIEEYLGYADSMDKLVYVFPLFFFSISMLVSLTTMTRMVEEHRNYMGTLKALGFSKKDIGRKFILYGGLAALFGGILGSLLGNFLIGPIIGNAYSTGIIVKPILVDFYPKICLVSILVGIVCTSLVAYMISRKSLKESAANLMRPKAPAKGNRIFLERFSPIWKRMDFLQKVTARNIFRYKSRMLMTLAGVIGCTGLLVMGFGLWTAVNNLVEKQFNEIAVYDVILMHERALSKDSFKEMTKDLDQDQRVEKKTQILFMPLSMEEKKGGERSLSLIVPKNKDFEGLIQLKKPRKEGIPLPQEGALVTEKLAKMEGLKKGSNFSFKDDQGIKRTVKVAGLVENYTGHYIYMSRDSYEKVMGEDYRDNSYLIQLDQKTKKNQEDFVSHYQSYKSVLAVTSFDQMKSMVDDLVWSLNVVVSIILILSSTLAVVVLYNLSNINIEERIRELSTIKVLGFYPKEVTSYIYRETWILTFIGIVLGLGMGKVLHYGVLQVVVPDSAMLYPKLEVWNFLLPAAITFLISLLVMVLVHRYLKKIDMVEALKGVE